MSPSAAPRRAGKRSPHATPKRASRPARPPAASRSPSRPRSSAYWSRRARHFARLLSRRYSPFVAELALLWHGFIGGRQRPVVFWEPAARDALETEVLDKVEEYLFLKQERKAAALLSAWKSIKEFIQANNDALSSPASAAPPALPAPIPRPDPFHSLWPLLYDGLPAQRYWASFARRHKLGPAPLPAFWDRFERFQPRRLDLVGWLSQHSHGLVLDIGSGAHSYVPVHTAADISAAALAANPHARHRLVLPPDPARWPLRPASFDTVMLNSSYGYLPAPHVALARIHSALRPGGVLLITQAPILPYHPAALFVEHEVDGAALVSRLRRMGFRVDNQSVGSVLRLVALKP